MLQVIIPISDNTIFFPKEEYFFPKPIIEVLNKPLIVQVIKHIEKSLKPDSLIFVIPKDLEIKWSIKRIISLSLETKSSFFIRENNTSGSLSSCLLASDLLDQGEVIAINMDEIIDYDLVKIVNHFRLNGNDAGVITYNASHPRLSYGLIDKNNNVRFCAEKKVISKFAFAGFYYFKNEKIFMNSCSEVLLMDDSLDGNFFLSSAINQIILTNGIVKAYKIPSYHHFSLFSPDMIKDFERSEFAKKLKLSQETSEIINIVIPAAGKGSRFSKNGWTAPKPFIELNGKPILQHVINNLATENSNITIILQEEHTKNYQNFFNSEIANTINIVNIDYITSGTAMTVMQAKKSIDKNVPLVIANSDQIIDFDIKNFIQDAITRNLDGSILVFRDKDRNPKWSFAKLDSEGFVERVAEKDPISEFATVGIYFFKNGSQFIDGVIEMVKRDDRVNNEFYTCPVYNYLISKNKKIGIFEIKASEMHGLGTPQDFINYQKLKNYPISKNQPI